MEIKEVTPVEIKEVTPVEIKEVTPVGIKEVTPVSVKEDNTLNKDKIYDSAKENLSPAEIYKVEEILQLLQRDVNCLHDGTRFAKKKALESIRAQTSAKLDQEILTAVYAGLCKPLLTLFYDPIEKCREISVTMVTEITAQISNIQLYLPYIVPMCVMRLGQKEITEPSEEIRELLMELIVQIISLSPNEIHLYCADIILILARTIADPFAEVKKLSCTCLINLSSVAPRQFYTQANSLLNPLLQSISHQHQKVRTVVIKALGALLNNGDNKMIEDVTSHLAQRTFDPCPPVREAVYEVVGGWMMTLTDRYSYFYKLLPLILTGVQDDVPAIATKSRELLEAAGKLWEQENEQDIKDQVDFRREIAPFYGVLEDVTRPRLGCRILVNRNLSKIVPGLLNDLNTWQTETRVKSVQLLSCLLLYSEEHTTQHLEKIMYAMYRASLEPTLSRDIDTCAQTLAQFVEPVVWKEFVLSALAGASSGEVKSRVGVSPQLCTSCLRVLSSFIRGSTPDKLVLVTGELMETLCTPEVNESSHSPLYPELQSVTDALISVLGRRVSPYSSQHLFLLLRLCSVYRGTEEVEAVESTIHRLADLQDYTVEELYKQHAPQLIQQLMGSHQHWTRHSPDHSLFGELLLRAGPTVSTIMPDIYGIFRDCTSKDKDPELRMSMFTLLGRLLREAPATSSAAKEFSFFSVDIIKEIILPNLEWRAGRTAGTVRCAAVSSLWALLKSDLLSQTQLKQVHLDVVAQLVSNLDDDNCATRLVSCNCLNFVLRTGGEECFPPDELHKLYLELLKRLDDSADEVRVAVTETFRTFFSLIPEDYNVGLYKAHLQAIYRGLLIHLDDGNKDIQVAVYEVLTVGGKIHPSYFCEHIENVKHKHRSSLYCDKLLQQFKE